MKLLLDTCVLSEIRRELGKQSVKDMVAATPNDLLFLSVLTVGEINKGIELLPVGAKKIDLQRWLNDLEGEFNDRILPIDVEITTLWGHLTARLQKAGVILPAVDGLIAATALRHGMKLVTRNTRHFKETGAIIFDPWE